MLRHLTLILLLLPALARASEPAEPLRLFVTVAPLAWLVEQIGGDRVTVHSLVRSGQDPHLFEPGPRQLGELQRADAYLSLGLPFERAWLPRVARQHPGLQLVRLDEAEPHGHHEHDHADHRDPHRWTDPLAMLMLSERLRDLLSALSPADAARFAAAQQRVAATLRALDAELRQRFAAMRSRVFLVHHPAWGHLAARYGLTQLAVEQAGKEPGPRALAALHAQIERHGIRRLFVEPQASDHLVRGLARTLGLQIVALDPLAADYPDNLRAVAALIAEGVQ